MSEITTSLILNGIAYFMPEGRKFHYNLTKVSEFFVNARKKYKILEGKYLEFDNEYSARREMDRTHTNLMMAGHLISWSPNYNPHEFRPKARISFERHDRPNLSKNQLGELEGLASDFNKEFGEDN